MILTIGTRKGGSGKSTVATNLSALRRIRGHDVSLVDTDDQQSSAMWAAMRAENNVDPYIPILCTTGKGVRAAVAAHAGKYEDIIIDVPGRDAEELRTSVYVSDVVALPLRPSNFDLWAFEKDLEMISKAKEIKDASGLEFRTFIFFNGVHTNPAVKTREIEALHTFLDNYKDELLASGIVRCPHYVSNRGAYNRAVSDGLSVHEITGGGVSDDHARHEIEQLYKYIYGSAK
ncbi:MAG: hypothetical protein CTY35_02060 [Methylotenera sp.]|uniref:AAA family ATPase n=1 Tax=Methylotenera sp. TaxID=2051956 RepID=UPI000D406774|nr:AAA family ATPase [Methylotenera sp.]PPC84409.1 MAG: hypothetical protein CTY38_02280 [Methylotenera sp.]PPD01050.1 MAG: hypothetical protein CTY35_02060 [Methylotenera sp.]